MEIILENTVLQFSETSVLLFPRNIGWQKPKLLHKTRVQSETWGQGSSEAGEAEIKGIEGRWRGEGQRDRLGKTRLFWQTAQMETPQPCLGVQTLGSGQPQGPFSLCLGGAPWGALAHVCERPPPLGSAQSRDPACWTRMWLVKHSEPLGEIWRELESWVTTSYPKSFPSPLLHQGRPQNHL